MFLLTLTTAVLANRMTAEAKSSVTLDQCANLGQVCDTAHASQWQNGNLNQSNSEYPEGSTVPYRAHFTQLTTGQTYAATIEWDTTQQAHHAIDYLTSAIRTVGTADPCAGISCTAPSNSLTIPVDPSVTAAGVTQIPAQAFHADGATFLTAGASVPNTGNLCASTPCVVPANPSAYSHTGDYTGNSSTSTTVYFVASGTDVVLSWGGHVATQADWGAGTSASSITGSPYHMRVLFFLCSDTANCSAGNEDRSMSNTAVAPVTTTTVPATTTTSTTSTTLAPSTTTTSTTSTTSTTTTLAPTTTTTLPATTTTVPGTTTTVASTTTVAASTTTVAAATTSTVAASTTSTTPTDFGVIFPATTTTEPTDYSVTYPNALPSTGSSMALNIIGALLVFLGLVLVPLVRRRAR